MKLNQFVRNLDLLLADLDRELPKIILGQAADAKAVIQKRIEERGVNAKGTVYKAYSENPLPTYFFKGKGRNKRAEDALELKKFKEKGISYAEWRRRSGLQVNHVDFSYTGRMWLNTAVVQTGKRGRHVHNATIGGRGQETKDKLRWNEKKKGLILEMSELEKKGAAEDVKKRIVRMVKNRLA